MGSEAAFDTCGGAFFFPLAQRRSRVEEKHLSLVSSENRQDIGHGLLQAQSNDAADVRIWVALASAGLSNVAEADTSQCNLSSAR